MTKNTTLKIIQKEASVRNGLTQLGRQLGYHPELASAPPCRVLGLDADLQIEVKKVCDSIVKNTKDEVA